MRVVLLICLFFCGLTNAAAQDMQPMQKRGRGISEKPIVKDGLQVTRFASRLGTISAITGHVDGTLYVSDIDRGRVYQLSDRNQDGTLDQTRVIANGFDAPSGVAVVDDTLYVSDAQAIWSLPIKGGPKSVFIPLTQSHTRTQPRPLLAMPSTTPRGTASLLLGVTKTDGPGQIISINPKTRRAVLLAQGPQAVLSIARSGKTIWAGTETGIVPQRGDALNPEDSFKTGGPVTGLVLPGQFKNPPDAFEPWGGHILVALGHAARNGTLTKGSKVAAIPTRFGNTAGRPDTFVSGFISRGARTGWGQPGPMWMDGRGLFLSDSWSGAVWRISQAAPKVIIEDAPPEEKPVSKFKIIEDEPEPAVAPSLVEGIEQTPGSLLKSGSQIKTGSQIKVGSTIVKQFEAEKKARDAAEKAKKAAEEATKSELDP